MTNALFLDDQARQAVTRQFRVQIHDYLLEHGWPPEDVLINTIAAFVIRTRGEQDELDFNTVPEEVYTILVNNHAGSRQALKREFQYVGTNYECRWI